MLKGMSWFKYCEWYYFYLSEPWGAPARDFYESQQLWALLAAINPKEPQRFENCIYRLLPSAEPAPISDDDLKLKLRQWRETENGT